MAKTKNSKRKPKKNKKKTEKIFIGLLISLVLALIGYFKGLFPENIEQYFPKKETGSIYAGQPIDLNYPGDLKVLDYTGFVVGYDEKRKNPAWVSYKVFSIKPGTRSAKRPSRFEPDPRLNIRVEHEDYSHSGYDRGHMAPNYAISTRYGLKGQLDTFYTSNIVPQKHSLNAGLWKSLEEKIANNYANEFQEIWVLTGPIYDPQRADRFLKSGIEIPDKFFMIIIDELAQEKPRAMAFIIPQEAKPKQSLAKYLTSIDEVEKQTGFDFLSKLEDVTENALEEEKIRKLW